MSKPEDIPQDVWDAAGRAHLSAHQHEAIARAILAAKAEEREACAALAEDGFWHAVPMAVGSGMMKAEWTGLDGPGIAAAIRKREG